MGGKQEHHWLSFCGLGRDCQKAEFFYVTNVQLLVWELRISACKLDPEHEQFRLNAFPNTRWIGHVERKYNAEQITSSDVRWRKTEGTIQRGHYTWRRPDEILLRKIWKVLPYSEGMSGLDIIRRLRIEGQLVNILRLNWKTANKLVCIVCALPSSRMK